MNQMDLKHFKEILEKQRQERQAAIGTMKENGTGEQDSYHPTELSNYDNHPADMGSELYQVEMDNNLKVHEEHQLKEIEDGLKRITQGTYGQCAFCGREIGWERLEALPTARLCIQCEEEKAIDPEILRNTRPVEEEVLGSPFGRKYLNQQEDDEYEGTDFMNDLEKYGSSDTPQDMGGYHDYREFYTNEVDMQGVVDRMDNVSNEDYKRQLPD